MLYIWPMGDQDFFKLNATQRDSRIVIELRDLPMDYDLNLDYPNQTPAKSSNRSGRVNENIDHEVGSTTGEYYISVVGKSPSEYSGTPYTLAIQVITPTATPTHTFTPTHTPTATPTNTPTITPTPTVTQTPTVTNTPTITLPPTATLAAEGTPARRACPQGEGECEVQVPAPAGTPIRVEVRATALPTAIPGRVAVRALEVSVRTDAGPVDYRGRARVTIGYTDDQVRTLNVNEGLLTIYTYEGGGAWRSWPTRVDRARKQAEADVGHLSVVALAGPAVGVKVPLAYVPFLTKQRAWVQNGGFESGLTGWEKGEEPLPVSLVPGDGWQGGTAVLLGNPGFDCRGGQVGKAWVSQQITVPDRAGVVLAYRYRILTNDVLEYEGKTFDSFDVYLGRLAIENRIWRDANGDPNLAGCSKPTIDLGWREKSHPLDAYRGQTVRLFFVNETRVDGWYNTWTYVDDVRVIDPGAGW